MIIRLGHLLVLIATCLLVSSCNLLSGAVPTPTVVTTPAAQSTTPAAVSTVSAEAEELPTIAEIIQSDPQFAALLEVVNSAELLPILSEPDAGPFTLFAPTNDAFANLPTGLTQLVADSSPQGLADVIRQHALGGRIDAEALLTMDSVVNVAGNSISVSVQQDKVQLNGTTLVVAENIQARNGIIHTVDRVLLNQLALSTNFLPTATPVPTIVATATPVPTPTPLPPTMSEILNDTGQFATFLATLNSARLLNAFVDPASGPYTIFAPTDAAFAALPEGTIELLVSDPDGALRDVLRYHMLAGRISAETIAENESIIPLSRDVLTIDRLGDGTLVFNQSSSVIVSDVRARNGVIHVIDQVLLPPLPVEEGVEINAESNDLSEALSNSLEEGVDSAEPTLQPSTTLLPTATPTTDLIFDPASTTVLDIFAQHPDLTQLFSLLTATNRVAMLTPTSDAPLTVFAPTNSALEALNSELVNQLLLDPAQFTTLFSNHIIEGANTIDQLERNPSITTQYGETLSLNRYGNVVIINNDIQLTRSDIQTSNGVIHLIDGIIFPSE